MSSAFNQEILVTIMYEAVLQDRQHPRVVPLNIFTNQIN